MALMEAMSANLLCIHSSYGALPETSFGFNHMYNYVDDWTNHANSLYQALKYQLVTNFLPNPDYHTRPMLDSKRVIDQLHNIETFAETWTAHLRAMKENGSRKKESSPQEG
jgi:hypothetical protein